jgi:hypothetical protein
MMENQELEWEERTIPNEKVNMVALLTFLPLTLAAFGPFLLIHGPVAVSAGFNWLFGNLFVFFAIFFGSIIIHEGLHALGWAWFGRVSLREMKFGIFKGNPYTHVKVPIRARAYQWGGALPGIVLGVVPAVVSWISGNGALMLFAAIMLATAGGDAIMLWLLRDVSPERLVQDHPSAIGCLVMKE